MDADIPELGPSLLRWANSFQFLTKIEAWKDLQDGTVLWMILQNVEPDYFSGPLPEQESNTSDNWIPRWQNLKQITRLVVTYIRDECGKLTELSKRMEPDLKAIAIDASPDDSMQLLKLILLVAMYCPLSNQRMIAVMEKLGPRVAIPIATSISQMESMDQQLVTEMEMRMETGSEMGGIATPDPAGVASPRNNKNNLRDPELEREEELIQALTTIKDLKDQNVALAGDLESTHDRVKRMQKELDDARYQLDSGNRGGAGSEALEQLQVRSNRDKEYITELETEIEATRTELENQEKQLEKLKNDSDSVQKLKDDLQLLRVERDDLMQKAKANENLKKKIQTLQESDKGNQSLREELESTRDELRGMQRLKDRVTALQKANEENMKTIQNGEQEIFDQKTTRKRLDHEIRLLSQRWEAAKDRQQRDQDTIAELQEKLQEADSGQGTVKASEEDLSGNLDDELTSGDQKRTEMKTEIARLRAELSQAQTESADTGVSQEAVLVREAKQKLQEKYEKLEKQYLDAYQENLGLESALKDAQDQELESRPFLELRDRLKTETETRTVAEKRLFEIEAELSDIKVRLQASESKLASVDKSKTEALEELKAAASSETSILKAEVDRLMKHVKVLETDLDSEKSLLRHALLDKAALLREDGALRGANEYKLVHEEIKNAQQDPSSTEDVALRLARRMEDAREALSTADTKIAQQRQDYEDKISELNAKLAKAEEVAAKGSKTPLQVNMERELSMMTTAWYDITARMQSDAVVLQRKAESPKSFLNRQRKLVEAPMLQHQQ